jgi:hypothetical protein
MTRKRTLIGPGTLLTNKNRSAHSVWYSTPEKVLVLSMRNEKGGGPKYMRVVYPDGVIREIPFFRDFWTIETVL